MTCKIKLRVISHIFLESSGRWKLQMYYALKFFAPILPSPYKATNGDVVIELISDLPRSFTGTLKTQIFRLNSTTPAYTQQDVVQAVNEKQNYTKFTFLEII